MKDWATAHYWLATFLVVVLVDAGVKFARRLLRTVNILFRGWPTPPLMDADGDIIHPKDMIQADKEIP